MVINVSIAKVTVVSLLCNDPGGRNHLMLYPLPHHFIPSFPPQFIQPGAEMGSRIVGTVSCRKTTTDNANWILPSTAFLITRKGTRIKEGGEIRKEGTFIVKGAVYKIKFMVIESWYSGKNFRCLSFKTNVLVWEKILKGNQLLEKVQ